MTSESRNAPSGFRQLTCGDRAGSMHQEIEVEIWNDREWTPALEALTERSETSSLAALLRSGKPIPAMVASALGICLDPPQGYRGATLHVKRPKYSWREAAQKIGKMRILRARILEVRGSGNLEAAIADIVKETGLSRATLFKALNFDNRESVLQSEINLGHGTEASRKTKRRQSESTRNLKNT